MVRVMAAVRAAGKTQMTDHDDKRRLLTARQIAQLLGKTEKTVLNLAGRPGADFPPSVKIGRRRLWSVVDYDQWLQCKTGKALVETVQERESICIEPIIKPRGRPRKRPTAWRP